MENPQKPNPLENLAALKSDLLSGHSRLIDVRELDEWEEFHLKSAKLLPLSELEMMSTQQLQKWLERPCEKIYLHCRSGGRALKVKARFKPFAKEVIVLTQSPRQLASLGLD